MYRTPPPAAPQTTSTLAIASLKGGVGKTTLSLNLGYALSERGWRTLLVDTDPQGSIAASIHGAQERGRGLLGWLEGESSLAGACIPTRSPNLQILPFTGTGQAAELAADGLAAILEAAPQLGSRLSDEGDFDVVVADTGSGLFGLTGAVLSGVQFVLIPVQAEPLALRAMPRSIELIGELNETGASVSLAGLVLTMVDSRLDASLSVVQEAWRLFPEGLVLDTHVPRHPELLAASAHGVPLALLRKRRPPLAALFEQLAAEVEPRIGLTPQREADEPIPLLD